VGFRGESPGETASAPLAAGRRRLHQWHIDEAPPGQRDTRWSLEVAFHETKGKLGFEDPQNRTERAVERTAPFAFIAYTLVIVWYVLHGQRSAAAKLPTMPWYTQKSGVTFSDMLATLRRTFWRERLLDPAATTADLRKSLRPLLDYVAGAA
jgi:hypothetical protein